MKTITLNDIASSVTLALTLGLAGIAAQANDFKDAYPAFAEARAQALAQAAGQRVVIQAPRPAHGPKDSPKDSVSTEASRAMLGEDSGSFWLAQQPAQAQPTTLARADAIQR